MQTSEPSGLLV